MVPDVFRLVLSQYEYPQVCEAIHYPEFLLNISGHSFSSGTAGPAFFGLGLKQSLIILTVVDIM